MSELDVRIPSARATVRELSGGKRRGIAIARATHWATKLVLIDEPTAELGVAETERVERIIQSVKGRNLAIVIVSHWSLDHLFLDQDGVPTLVEVKRQSDTRIRREVVGQMLGCAGGGASS